MRVGRKGLGWETRTRGSTIIVEGSATGTGVGATTEDGRTDGACDVLSSFERGSGHNGRRMINGLKGLMGTGRISKSKRVIFRGHRKRRRHGQRAARDGREWVHQELSQCCIFERRQWKTQQRQRRLIFCPRKRCGNKSQGLSKIIKVVSSNGKPPGITNGSTLCSTLFIVPLEDFNGEAIGH